MSKLSQTSITLPPLGEVLQILTLQAEFNTTVVLLGTTFLGVAAGVIGTFAVLRKRSLMGDALAHATLPGICIAFLIATALQMNSKSLIVLMLGATISGVLGILCVQAIVKCTRLSQDSAIGIVLSVFFGLGIVLLSVIQNLGTGSEGGLNHFIYGQTAAMRKDDAIITLSIALFAVLCCYMLLKEFRIVCFDANFAQSQGWPTSTIDLLMMTLVTIVTVIGLQSVGLILIIALLIVPAAAARFWSERLGVVLFLGGLFGGLSGFIGSIISASAPGLPTGAIIVLSAGLIFIVSFALAPNRGLLSSVYRRTKLRLQIFHEHFLRTAFEYFEATSEKNTLIPFSSIKNENAIGSAELFFIKLFLRLNGSIETIADKFRLTNKGHNTAYRLTRNHRLWEEYLITFGHLPASHVHLAADMVEHVLSKEIVQRLESALRKKSRLPVSDQIIPSAHPTVEGKV